MEFVLTYQGDLSPKSDASQKMRIREYFHFQLCELWKIKPLSEVSADLFPVEAQRGIEFRPLVREDQDLEATLSVTLLRPEPTGRIINAGGNLDNRVKVLLDALRIPSADQEIPSNWTPGEDLTPLYCLLQDDKLVVGIEARTERWLMPSTCKYEILAFVRVMISQRRTTWERNVFRWQEYSGP